MTTSVQFIKEPVERKPRAKKVNGTECLLPCAQVSPNFTACNDRQEFDPDKLAELAESIRANGLAQPIIVRPAQHPDKPGIKYEIVAGERRYRAVAWVLKWESIPAIVREMTDEHASAIMLVENTGRADLLPTEEAQGFRKRIEQFGWDEAKVAEVAGKSVEYVRGALKLLNLLPEFWPMVNSGQLPIGHAREASQLPPDKQRAAIRVFAQSNGMNFAQFTTVVRSMAEADQASLFGLEEFFIEESKKYDNSVLSGLKARVNVPTSNELPAVQYTMAMTAGEVIHQYINDLVATGHEREAAAIGNLYTVLVKYSWVKLPRNIAVELAK